MRLLRSFTLALAIACDSTNVDPPSLVNTLRVLGVEAEGDKAFAAPGDLVKLQALVADPLGDGRPVQFAWGTCLNPGSAEITACAAAVGSLTTGGDSFTVTVPANALDDAPPNVPLGSVGVIFAACAGQIVMKRAATSPVTCVDAMGNVQDRAGFVWGEKRITVLPSFVLAIEANKNHNPAITTIRVDGDVWAENDEIALTTCDVQTVADCPPEDQHTIEMDITPASIETYDLPGVGLQTEDVVGFFFTSQGEYKDDYLRPDSNQSMATVLALDKPDRTRSLELWFVVRDDRGGITFTSRRAQLQ